jgi:hypothetical protein
MINWALAKKSAVAVHRNGGRSVIESVKKEFCITWVYFKDCITCEGFYENGACCKVGTSPFDIIEIEAAPKPVMFKVYLNVFKDGFSSYMHERLDLSKNEQTASKIDTLEITYTVGEGTTVRSVKE